MSLASWIRDFIDTIFRTPLVRRLEEDLVELRVIYQERIAEKDRVIAAQRHDIELLQGVLTVQQFENRQAVTPKVPTSPSFIDSVPAPTDWRSSLEHWTSTIEGQEDKDKKDCKVSTSSSQKIPSISEEPATSSSV